MSRFRYLLRSRVYSTVEVGGIMEATSLCHAGQLSSLGQGLFWAARDRRLGAPGPSDLEVAAVLLRGLPFLVTGNERWDALGLGATASLNRALIYTTRCGGEFVIGGRTFELRRLMKGVRRFPTGPVREWWIIDLLLENLTATRIPTDLIVARLSEAIATRRFNREVLVEQTEQWATPDVRRLVSAALAGADSSPSGLIRDSKVKARKRRPE